MENLQIPNKQGQICKIISPLADENPDDVFIVSEDPADFDDDENIYVVSLNDLQKNIRNPAMAVQLPIRKNELSVVGNDLEDYIATWNGKS